MSVVQRVVEVPLDHHNELLQQISVLLSDVAGARLGDQVRHLRVRLLQRIKPIAALGGLHGQIAEERRSTA